MPYTGSCVPGDKMYVTVNGDIHMCERITPLFPIGNVYEGLDIGKITAYVNEYNEHCGKCADCSFTRLCNICMARVADGDRLKVPESYCASRRGYIEKTLSAYADLMEANPSQLDSITSTYYKDLREIAGSVYD
jgi:uncharacterized protein